jgi:hypothetical protein
MRLSKAEALAFVESRAEIFDACTNPFAKSAWLLHLVEQIVEPSWTILAPESLIGGESVMLLYDDGRTVRPLTNYYASLYTPWVTTGESSPARHLVRELNRCPWIAFGPLDAEEPSTGELQTALEDRHWYVRRYFCHGNWYLAGQPFETYLKGRGSQLRNTITRKGKAFPGDLRIFTEPDEVDAGMDAYEAVYAKSWKQPEPYPNFARGWARICAERGWLRLGIASMCGVPIAAHFWFVVDGKAHIWKLAYDEEYAKTSAGTLLTAHLMRHALDVDKVTEVDYLTGDDPYKAAWMTHRRERIGLMACNMRTFTGMARAAYEAAGSMRQRLMSRGRQAPGSSTAGAGAPGHV